MNSTISSPINNRQEMMFWSKKRHENMPSKTQGAKSLGEIKNIGSS